MHREEECLENQTEWPGILNESLGHESSQRNPFGNPHHETRLYQEEEEEKKKKKKNDDEWSSSWMK